MLALERRIDGGLMLLADEAAQAADVHLRRRMLGALLAYHPLWLRAGLEVHNPPRSWSLTANLCALQRLMMLSCLVMELMRIIQKEARR